MVTLAVSVLYVHWYNVFQRALREVEKSGREFTKKKLNFLWSWWQDVSSKSHFWFHVLIRKQTLIKPLKYQRSSLYPLGKGELPCWQGSGCWGTAAGRLLLHSFCVRSFCPALHRLAVRNMWAENVLLSEGWTDTLGVVWLNTCRWVRVTKTPQLPFKEWMYSIASLAGGCQKSAWLRDRPWGHRHCQAPSQQLAGLLFAPIYQRPTDTVYLWSPLLFMISALIFVPRQGAQACLG